MMRRLALWLLALLSIGLLVGPELRGEEEADPEAVALAEAVQCTKDSLIRGLSAGARYGEPIERPVAEVTLVKGHRWKTIVEMLHD